ERHWIERQRAVLMIERCQPRADVGSADAITRFRRFRRIPWPHQTGAVVAYPEHEPVAAPLSTDLHEPRLLAPRDSVAQRVLDEGLKDEVRHEGASHVVVR